MLTSDSKAKVLTLPRKPKLHKYPMLTSRRERWLIQSLIAVVFALNLPLARAEGGITAETIGRTKRAIVIDRTCDQVWNVLLDFGGIAKWYKSFSWSRSVGGKPGHVGDIREFARSTTGQTVREKLIYLDSDGMELAYTHISNPPVKDSLALVSLTNIAQKQCLATWSNTYRLKNGQSAEQTAAFFSNAYTNVLKGLKIYVEALP